ncbi:MULTISPECIES: WhiB family transcriptional regulator [Rhodococcus]|uniref:WhiB family transcriptional regulator n=1 Tax=Rhodococcus TaxID=1827 RepID=UPI0002D2349E|nr:MULTISPECIES: WhiB family transcriptional regulator [Rhodococcus]PND50479.1 WhiB family transcriptional regulator [Rhodococcus sp. ENV425]WKW98285.1 WhiB family transcriptional regulator [Rhodococcus aetherivorans]CCW13148.1 Sporulation regulatory protein WhiB [Rhodococcus aetherivorans]
MSLLSEHTRPALGWQFRGSCRSAGEFYFFAPDDEPSHVRRRREAAAKRICASCPVLTECRTHAMLSRERHGVWGGLSERERRIRR